MSAVAAPREALRAIRRAGNHLVNLIDPPILVLAYHRVIDLAHDPQSLAVHPDRFQAQMRHLKRHYTLLRLGDPWPPSGGPGAIVTFDDGYADNATTALPILEGEGVPATFFVSVDAVASGREFWWDELERWLLTGPSIPDQLPFGEGPEGRVFPTRTAEEREDAYRTLHPLIRNLTPLERERRLAPLRAACGGDVPPRRTHRPLTVQEVGCLGASSFAAVGAHGMTHTPFAALPIAEQRREMEASREQLRAWSNAPVDTFSFPFGGRGDFTRDSVRVAREVGFRRIAANIPGQVRRLREAFVVPRFLVRDWDADRFAVELRRFETA